MGVDVRNLQLVVCQVACVAALVINVPVYVHLFPVTLSLHFAAAATAEARRAQKQQQASAAAAAAAGTQAQYEETTRVAGDFEGERRIQNYFDEVTGVFFVVLYYTRGHQNSY